MPSRSRLRTWHVVSLWLLLMAPLSFWGLPSSDDDPFLFGGDPAWKAERYSVAPAIEARRARDAGADTDLDPVTPDGGIVDLTSTDADRAAILLRYRLYSRQPDEMITFQALQRMNPRAGDFDPRLYQYGGGYIYLIGAVIGVASRVGLIELSGDVGTYLERPELFARFFVAARFVSLVFGALTLVAVIKLTRRLAGRGAGWVAALFVASTPVFITGALEAKPHLPSACMLLWAILSALAWSRTGRGRRAVWMGLQAGYAFGLVLTGIAGAALWPAAFVARREPRPPTGSAHVGARCPLRHLIIAAVVALAVYLITNPYVLMNLFTNRAALFSNVGNSTAMYSIDRIPAGALRVAQLLVESGGVCLCLAGLFALIWFAIRRPRETALISVTGLALLLLCTAIGAGKPAEFARFLLLPIILLAIGAATLLVRVSTRNRPTAILAAIIILATMRTPAYLRSFYLDARGTRESRHLAAEYLQEHVTPAEVIGVVQEPAPYSIPPLDFTRASIRLLPADMPSTETTPRLPDWLVLTADNDTVHMSAWWQQHYEPAARFAPSPLWLSRIAWANKPVYVYRRIGAD